MSIKIKKSRKGLLHKNLGVPENEKIPSSKLKIDSSDSPALKKRKQFAINSKKWDKGQEGAIMSSPVQSNLVPLSDEKNRQLIERYGNPIQEIVRPFKNPAKKKNNFADIAVGALTIADLLIPNEEIKEPVVYPKASYNPNQYGTGSMAIAEHGTILSKSGYKRDSKDKNYPKLRIPSNNITMKNVPHPVIGTGSDGTQQVMYPGQDYFFPDAEYVDETPLAKKGRKMKKPQGQYISKSYQSGGKLSELAKANIEAKRISVAKNLYAGENAYVTEVPKYLDNSGALFDPTKNMPLVANVPMDVKELEWDKERNLPYYINPSTGYIEYTKPEYMNLSRFRKQPVPDIKREIASLNKGGKMPMYELGNKIKIEDDAFTPISDKTLMINGNSHNQGGTMVKYGKKLVEAEAGEPMFIDEEGNAVIAGNLKNPVTGNKFKHDVKMIAKKEAKMNKLMDYSTNLVKTANPYDKWDNLKFNAGNAMMVGAKLKGDQLSSLKEHLGDLQEASLTLTGIPQKKAQNGLRMDFYQDGGKLDFRGTNIQGLDPKIREFVKLLESKGMGGYSGSESGISKRNTKSGRPSRHSVGEALDTFLSQPNAYESIINDADLSKFLVDSGLTVINEYDPEIAKKTGASAGHLHIGYDKGTPISDKFRTDVAAKYKSSNPNWGWGTIKNPKGKIIKGAPQGDQQFFPYKLEKAEASNVNEEVKQIQRIPDSDFKYNFSIKPINNIPVSSDVEPLQFKQLYGEAYAAATNREEPVWLQQYQPELYQPYQISLQDRRNRITSQGRATRQYLSDNANAQATLAAGEYDALSNIDAEEFRINQGVAQDITNKNKLLLNESQKLNLSLADTQYTRQATAKSKTKAANQAILNSISNKVLQNQLENRTLKVYENLYPHFRYDSQYRLNKEGNPGGAYLNVGGNTNSQQSYNTTKKQLFDKENTLSSTTITTPSLIKTSIDEEKLKAIKQTNMLNMQGYFNKRKTSLSRMGISPGYYD